MTEQYRVALHAGWSLWRPFVLRGAGFPAALLEPLAAPRTIAVIDELLAAEAAIAEKRDRAIDVLRAEVAQGEGPQHGALVTALRGLRRKRPSDPRALFGAPAGVVTTVADAEVAHRELRDRLAAAYDEEQLATSRALRRAITDPRFHEAVLWQNRGAYRSGFAWLLRQPADASDSHTHKIEAVVASYLQRYCVKNDSIGFFGPIGYGTFAADDREALAEPGAQLLARRTVYFEHWGLEQLAEQLGGDRELLAHAAPRRNPALPGIDPRLPADFAELLAACDGVTPAHELAGEDDEIYDMLEQLRDRGFACWSLEIPTTTPHPERALGELVGPRPELAALATARDRVAAAAGDPVTLEAALEAFDATFVSVAERDPTRRAGEMYAGRTLIYEDCVRDYQLVLGPAFVRGLGPALALVLQSARWYTHQNAEQWRQRLDAVYDELHAASGGPVELVHLSERAAVLFDDTALVDAIASELQRRWATIFATGAVQRSAAIASAVQQAFAAPHPGWPMARLHAPDLMVAAASVRDVLDGKALYVLGELHSGVSMAMTPLLLRECPDAAQLIDAFDADAGRRRVALVRGRASCTRLDRGPTARCDYEIEVGPTASALPRDRVLAISELVVVRASGGLVVQTRDGRVRFDILTVFERNLLNATVSSLSFAAPAAHTPRLQIDELVISRERWQLAPTELSFCDVARGPDRLVAARRWAAALGIPRHVFVRVPEEIKPIYVDLHSPLYVDTLAKLARSATRLTISEMLPAPDQLWLADRDGNRYTCELRLTAVDPIACPAREGV